jgi:hypothetical protein
MKTTRLLTAAAIAAGALLAGHAQASAQTIGFKVGPTFSKLHSTDDNDGSETLKSFGGGGFLRFGMMGLGMQGEVLAITRGVSFTDSGVDADLKITDLEVPILARFGAGTGMVSPYLMVGPTFGFELSCKVTADVLGTSNTGDCDDAGEGPDSDFPRKKFDVGATGVGGLEFKAGPGALLVEGRYTYGLTKINDDDSGEKVTNRTWAIMAGYSFTMH